MQVHFTAIHDLSRVRAEIEVVPDQPDLVLVQCVLAEIVTIARRCELSASERIYDGRDGWPGCLGRVTIIGGLWDSFRRRVDAALRRGFDDLPCTIRDPILAEEYFAFVATVPTPAPPVQCPQNAYHWATIWSSVSQYIIEPILESAIQAFVMRTQHRDAIHPM